MSDEYKFFRPDWIEDAPKKGTYRSIFKWGDPHGYKHPNEKLFIEMKNIFNLTDNDFKKQTKVGNEQVKCRQKIRISPVQINALSKIVGKENASTNDYDRIYYSHGKTIEEAITLREGKHNHVSDIVLHPRDKNDVKEIVKYCNSHKIPIYVYGGGSSVNLGLTASKGGVTIAMNTHMNKIIKLNEENSTVTVQAGMMGPAFEEALNNAPAVFSAKQSYTCGHFPQSFEYSSVGGWVVTLGSGQASSYYGDAYDLVVSQEIITPRGTIKTMEFPATATGPKVNDIIKGSEGTFGVVVELTMKVFKHMPKNRQRFGYIFPSWEDAVNATREISQGEFGMPAVMRISDQEETHIGLKLYGIDGTILDKLMRLRGYKPMERCLFLGSAEGEKSYTKNVKKNVKKICKKHGGMYLTGYATKQWEPGRYRDPYLREDLQDYGILIDTLESGVSWDKLHELHQGVRKFIKDRPGTIAMTHASHFYPQGTNLYFIFIMKTDDPKEYKEFQEGIIENINKFSGSLSHHHGVGKMVGPWMEKHLGTEQMDVLRALKKHFDPNNIMNPGGQMGLDGKKSVTKIKEDAGIRDSADTDDPAKWNSRKRDTYIDQAKSQEYDLIIIGGGITGAGVAREAALRGMSFCMVDKNDFAFGTSSRSSKLAHGGMRYLASAEFGLVRESTTERNWLMEHFPNQVRPLGFLYCSYKKGKDKVWQIKFATTMYDVLSNWFSKFKNYRKKKYFTPEFVKEFEPAITQSDPELGKMKMAGFYYDTNIDDGRLTVETIKESLLLSNGASTALNYAKVTDYTRNEEGIINGVVVRDELTKKRFKVKGKVVLACGGIWTDEVMEKSEFGQKKIYPTKGVHVVVPNERIGNRNAFGIRSFDDGRFFFVLRRGNVSVIGTTDTDYYNESKNLDEPWCTKEDCDYLFNTVNRLFPYSKLTYDDIIGTYAGIRPLIKDENAKDESAVSRNHEILESEDRLVAIAGGKLTTYRLMAEELLFYISKKGYIDAFSKKEHYKKGFTKVPFLVGITKDDFYAEVKERGLDNLVNAGQLEYFFLQFGKQAFDILENISRYPKCGEPFIEGYAHCEAEIQFILEHESAPKLVDIMCRRTEAQWMVWHHMQKELAEKVAAVMGSYYKWTSAQKREEMNEYMEYVKNTIWF